MTAPTKKKRARAVVDEETGDIPILLMKWDAPNYYAIIDKRLENLERLRANIKADPTHLAMVKAYYAEHPADFINDWGMTHDPRNAEIDLPTLMPFILFERQRQWVDWVIGRWRARRPGLCEKSRDMGVSWLAMALSCTLCLFRSGISIGVGSRKSEYVDKIGTHKPLIPKARMFMENLPVEFLSGYESWRDAPYMRVTFPGTGSLIAGEGGDDIGRGDRTSIYFVDEYAHFERAELTEAALSQTTNCRIDMSSVRGMNNAFARKRHGGKVDVFIFDWREDPRKNDAWYLKQQEDLDPVVVAQEIDRDYGASVTGIVIPNAWVRASLDAHKKLGHAPSGEKWVSLDVADEGVDKNCIAVGQGMVIKRTEERSGKGGDIFQTVEWTFEVCDAEGVTEFTYDASGLGAGVRGDARVINERRALQKKKPIRAVGFTSSGEVFDPEGIVEGTKGGEGDKGRMNKDYYANPKAQGHFELRRLFRNTYRRVVENIPCAPDDMISIDTSDPDHMKTVAELSQSTFKQNPAGKIVINKKPDGNKSPNRADAVMQRYAPKKRKPVQITDEMIRQVMRAGARR